MLVSKLTQCQPKPDILLKFAHAKIVMNDETKVNCFVFMCWSVNYLFNSCGHLASHYLNLSLVYKVFFICF